jgi:catechol 2,3-dioxygenase-like lactoylglutathione lyase family enzyme
MALTASSCSPAEAKKEDIVTNDELREVNRTRKIHQIGFVTRDLERSLKAWVENLGVGPWKIWEFTEETEREFEVDGQPVTDAFKFRVATSWVGDTQIELIEPVYGNLAYWRHLQTKGEGLHHFKERISDEQMPKVLADYRAKGIPVMQGGRFDRDTHYNLDSEAKLDFVVELGNCQAPNLSADMFSSYPPDEPQDSAASR